MRLRKTILIDAHLPSLQPQLKAKHFKETLGIFQNSNEKWKKTKDENLALACKTTSQVSSLFFLYYYIRAFYRNTKSNSSVSCLKQNNLWRLHIETCHLISISDIFLIVI